MRVDVPAPVAPTRAWTSPARRSNRHSFSAWTPGKSLLIPSISTSSVPACATNRILPPEERGCRTSRQPRSRSNARSLLLLVQQRRDVRLIDVRLVVVLVPGVDVLIELVALDGLDRGFDALEADADRVLGDRAGLGAGADRVHLLLTGVIAAHTNLAGPPRFLHALHHSDGRALVRAQDALQVRVRLQDRLCEVRPLELIAAAVLGRDDLDVRVLVLDLIVQAFHPIAAGPAGLVCRDAPY